GLGGWIAGVVFPSAVPGGGGELRELVESLVAAGDFGADGAVDRLGEFAAVFLADFTIVHDGLLLHYVGLATRVILPAAPSSGNFMGKQRFRVKVERGASWT